MYQFLDDLIIFVANKHDVVLHYLQGKMNKTGQYKLFYNSHKANVVAKIYHASLLSLTLILIYLVTHITLW